MDAAVLRSARGTRYLGSLEREPSGPVYSDEHLDFWGEVYLANPWLRARGVTFATFLRAPAALLMAAGRLGGRA